MATTLQWHRKSVALTWQRRFKRHGIGQAATWQLRFNGAAVLFENAGQEFATVVDNIVMTDEFTVIALA